MTMRYMINSENAAWRIVEGEAVILNADTTYYYSLNKTGTFLWQLLLEQDLGVGELATGLSEHFARPRDEITDPVATLIAQLQADRLINATPLDDEGRSARPIAELIAEVASGQETNSGEEYQPPQLKKFDTLEKLIVSGE